MQADPGTESPRRTRLMMLGPSPDHPGGITRVVESWRSAGLGERVELTEIHTSSMYDPVPRQVVQAARSMLALAAALARRQVDVVYLHASTSGSLGRKLMASWLARAFRVPFVVQIHSGEFQAWTERSRPAFVLARGVIRHAAVAVVLAEHWVTFMSELGAREVRVIPNGLPASELSELARVRRLRAERDAAPIPTLLFYGRFSPTKGADRIATALVGSKASSYEIRLFGNGDRRWLESAFAPFADHVTIGGWLDLEGKVRELARATVLMVPSRAEGFGQVLLDARAAGVPVVATDCGATGEVLSGHEPVLLTPCREEIALKAAVESVLDGRWPPPEADPSPPFPDRFKSEQAVETVAALVDRLAGRSGDQAAS